jgi:hypothetical protein
MKLRKQVWGRPLSFGEYILPDQTQNTKLQGHAGNSWKWSGACALASSSNCGFIRGLRFGPKAGPASGSREVLSKRGNSCRIPISS